MIKRVLSIDPGGTNGICEAVKEGKDWNIVDVDAVDADKLFETVRNFGLGRYRDDELLIIYEQYKLYSDKADAMIGNEFETVQVIGVIKYLTKRRNMNLISSPTSNKAFWGDKRLHEMGLYVPIEHKRDAIRHFLYWLYFIEKGADLKDVISKPK